MIAIAAIVVVGGICSTLIIATLLMCVKKAINENDRLLDRIIEASNDSRVQHLRTLERIEEVSKNALADIEDMSGRRLKSTEAEAEAYVEEIMSEVRKKTEKIVRDDEHILNFIRDAIGRKGMREARDVERVVDLVPSAFLPKFMSEVMNNPEKFNLEAVRLTFFLPIVSSRNLAPNAEYEILDSCPISTCPKGAAIYNPGTYRIAFNGYVYDENYNQFVSQRTVISRIVPYEVATHGITAILRHMICELPMEKGIDGMFGYFSK